MQRNSLPPYNARTLLFSEPGVERGFLLARAPKLRNGLLIGASLNAVYQGISVLLNLLQGWSTSGGQFVATHEGQRLGRQRFWCIVLSLGLSLTAMLFTRVPLMRCWRLNPVYFEIGCAILTCMWPVLIVVQHPWYLARLCGVSDPWSHITDPLHWTDGTLIFNLIIWLHGIHLIMPMRWVMLLPAEVMIVLGYVVPALWPGSHLKLKGIAVNSLAMIFIVVGAAWGQRNSERLERDSFTLVAAERSRRAEAEHRLWRAENAWSTQQQQLQQEQLQQTSGDEETRSTALSSLPSTTQTGKLFALEDLNGGTVEERLGEILDLGFKEKWLISPEALQPLAHRHLGAGGFGLAFVASYYGAEVVLKAPRLNKDKATMQSLLATSQELRVLRRLRHPNIVGFYGTCLDPGSSEIVLVLEYIRGDVLHVAIQGTPSQPHAIVDRCVLADNVSSALRYLHAQTPAIIHGDVKTSNVLVEQHPMRRNAKLLDLGLCRVLTRRAQNFGGTLKWMAPETIRKEACSRAPSADVFSFGRLLYFIMTGCLPLKDVSRDEVVDSACSHSSPELEWPEDTPLLEAARALSDKCLALDPSRRPSIASVQASLRSWCESSLSADPVRLMLAEAFQKQGDCNLSQALQDARKFFLAQSGRASTSSNCFRVSDRQSGSSETLLCKSCSSGSFGAQEQIDADVPKPEALVADVRIFANLEICSHNAAFASAFAGEPTRCCSSLRSCVQDIEQFVQWLLALQVEILAGRVELPTVREFGLVSVQKHGAAISEPMWLAMCLPTLPPDGEECVLRGGDEGVVRAEPGGTARSWHHDTC